MTEIKVSIEGFGFIGDDDDEKETHLEKSVKKSSSEDYLTETDLKQILDTIIASVKEIKLLYPDEQTEGTNHTNSRLESIKFEVTLVDSATADQVFEEQDFFELVAKHESLGPLILDYCKVTDDGEEGTRMMITDEEEEAPPAGTHAILALVDQNKKWIPHYIEFLRTNDLDHEVEQMWDIKAIIEKYGWCKETYALAIARNVSCCGQAGKEQFEQLQKDGLEESLTDGKERALFLESIRKEFQEWKAFKFRLEDGSKKYYLSHVVSYVEHFEQLLTKEEITDIETFLLQKWEAYNEGQV